ncbi:MAG: hypothetical protein PUE12_04300 [Oscillospiraceae bacterium]|nr:hypothetical protein [Oscillospiraceae bacterium]
MNEKKFYIITFIEFAIFKLLYSIYYPFIIGFIRKDLKDLTGSISAVFTNVIPIILILIPIALFILLISVSIKYGKKHLDLWSRKQVILTLLMIFIPQLIPLPF